MKEHFNNEIRRLQHRLGTQGHQVELSIQRALDAFSTTNTELAQSVIADDSAIDAEEICIEEECLKILALYQPVASDLRLVAAALKINTALERMADFGVHIAERVEDLAGLGSDPAPELIRFGDMQKLVLSMLREALDAVRHSDTVLAYSIIDKDDAVDTLHRNTVQLCRELLQRHAEAAGYYVDCISISRDLERIADLTTDICEHVVYLETGKIIRHRGA